MAKKPLIKKSLARKSLVRKRSVGRSRFLKGIDAPSEHPGTSSKTRDPRHRRKRAVGDRPNTGRYGKK